MDQVNIQEFECRQEKWHGEEDDARRGHDAPEEEIHHHNDQEENGWIGYVPHGQFCKNLWGFFIRKNPSEDGGCGDDEKDFRGSEHGVEDDPREVPGRYFLVDNDAEEG